MSGEHEYNGHGHNGHARDILRGSIAKNLLIATVITAVIFVAELIGGILTNSLALVSDAGHMFIDIASLLLSFAAIKISQKAPTARNTFGLYRVEILAALVNGATLFGLSGFIFYEAIKRLGTPETVNSVPMIIIAVIGLVSNIATGLLLHGDSHHNINARGAFLHVVGDALSSVGVIVAGLIIYFTKWQLADPIVSMVMAAVILKGAYGLVKESVDVLLESVPKNVDLETVKEEIKTITAALEVHHVHFWTISSNVYALAAHVRLKDMNISETEGLSEQVRLRLKAEYNIEYVTLQFECSECREEPIEDGAACVVNVNGHKHRTLTIIDKIFHK